jgi:tetratricopeptide (TPR) repeat protein
MLLLLTSCSANWTALEVWRGNTLFRKGEDALALLRYFQALERPAGRTWAAWIRYDIGSSYVSLGELEPGIRVLDEVLEEIGTAEMRTRWQRKLFFRTRFNRAAAAYERGAYSEAARGFAAALQIQPESWDAKVNLELSLLEQAQRPAAPVQRQASPEAADVSEESRKVLEQISQKEVPSWVSSQGPQDSSEDW